MKQFIIFSLFTFTLLSFSACISDDDGGETPTVTILPNEDDLNIELVWTTTEAEFDLGDVSAPGGVILDSEEFSTGTIPNVTFSGDDTDQPGEEFIRFNNSAPDGRYVVEYDLGGWDGADTDLYEAALTITSQSTTQTFNNSIDSNGNVTVAFTKSGGTLTFE
ncbi:MAG: hypothetical protein AAF544_13175 [Bacteroidota bacterium]